MWTTNQGGRFNLPVSLPLPLALFRSSSFWNAQFITPPPQKTPGIKPIGTKSAQPEKTLCFCDISTFVLFLQQLSLFVFRQIHQNRQSGIYFFMLAITIPGIQVLTTGRT